MNPFKVENDRLIFIQNGKDCGTVYKEVDGYYVWAPDDNAGCWESYYLRAISELLDDMNRDWHNSVMEYFRE